MTAQDELNEVEKIQLQYKNLIESGKVTKADLCQLLVPFREKHGLTDLQTLTVARKGYTKKETQQLFESLAMANASNVTPYITTCGNVTINIWWYKRLDNKVMVYINAIEYNRPKDIRFLAYELAKGYKPLKWLENIQRMDRTQYKQLRTEIWRALADSEYRLDSLDYI